MKKTEQGPMGLYFLLIIIGLYFITALFNFSLLITTFHFLITLLKQIIPVLFVVFVLMALINWLVSPEKLVKHLGKDAGFKGWMIAIFGGILSTGPIYAWYPLLQDMKSHGVREGFISAFIYNRAIKPALLPLLIVYFGLIYTLVLSVVMMIVSIFQGMIVEKIVEAARK